MVDLISESFTGESTDDKVLVQIFKALQAAVSCTAKGSTIHQMTLLKVVRTVYNIFLMTKKSVNQILAQSILEQMMAQIFSRCRPIPKQFTSDYQTFKTMESIPEVAEVLEEVTTKVSGVIEEQPVSEFAESIVMNIVDTAVIGKRKDSITSSANPKNTQFIDAFLVFRALNRLSIKPLPEAADQKTLALKSKILSLHLLNLIVRDYFDVISSKVIIDGITVEPGVDGGQQEVPVATADGSAEAQQQITFQQAVKQYLCVSVSRNAVSLVPEVMERSLDIFYRLIMGMRHALKVRNIF